MLRPSGPLRTLASRSLQLDAAKLRKQLACRGARRAVAVLRAGFLTLELLSEHRRSDLFAHELFGGAFGKRNHAIDGRGAAFEHAKQLTGSGLDRLIARIRRDSSLLCNCCVFGDLRACIVGSEHFGAFGHVIEQFLFHGIAPFFGVHYALHDSACMPAPRQGTANDKCVPFFCDTGMRQRGGARDAGRPVAWMSVGFAQAGTRMVTSTVARNGQLIRRFHSAGNSPTWHFANETHIAPTNARPHPLPSLDAVAKNATIRPDCSA